MAKLKFQFDDDKPIGFMEVEDNKKVALEFSKTNAKIGEGVNLHQKGQVFTFIDGKKKFKIFIE